MKGLGKSCICQKIQLEFGNKKANETMKMITPNLNQSKYSLSFLSISVQIHYEKLFRNSKKKRKEPLNFLPNQVHYPRHQGPNSKNNHQTPV